MNPHKAHDHLSIFYIIILIGAMGVILGLAVADLRDQMHALTHRIEQLEAR